jgi:tetratricopeptide (TPR) repeat protein
MSLLIKALNQAEKSQTTSANTEAESLSLAPNQSSADQFSAIEAKRNTRKNSASDYVDGQQSRAANVFVAKTADDDAGNIKWIVLAGLGLLFGLGGYFYYQFNKLNAPNTSQIVQAAPVATPAEQLNGFEMPKTETIAPASAAPVVEAAPTQEMVAVAPVETEVVATEVAPIEPAKSNAFQVKESASETLAKTEIAQDVAFSDEPPTKKTRMVKSGIASKSVSVSVTKNVQANSVNSTLMNAYQAYKAGDDDQAQALYRQVLRKDAYSADALLGMAAIAQRQGRDADAASWYGKVLEADPRNPIAQAAMLSNAQTNLTGQDAGSAESHIKNMLSKSPDDANLHANLANFYAEQNQWADAQQSYFEAFRLNPSNADFAFNLAVSLDQMGKPNLALPYYQKAQQLLQNDSQSSLNQTELAARIAAITNSK